MSAFSFVSGFSRCAFLLPLLSVALLAASACDGSGGTGLEPGLALNPEVSGCGGFEASEPLARPLAGDNPEEPCNETERLRVSYDAARGLAQIENTRVSLNCCGEHSIGTTREEDTLVILEQDEPEWNERIGEGTRCSCMCFFDWRLELADLSPGALAIRLMRHVTDTGDSPQLVWSGVVELGATPQVVDIRDHGIPCGQTF